MNSSGYRDRVQDYYGRHLDTLDQMGRYGLLKVELAAGLCAPDAQVLAAGCGTGTVEMALAGRARAIHGCDLTYETLARFRQAAARAGLANVSQVNADLAALPYRAETFDLVFSYSTLYYVRGIEAAMAEFGRVLKPGGRAVLEFGNALSLNALHSRWAYDCPHFFLTAGGIDRALRAGGLTVLGRRYFYLIPSFLFRGPLGARLYREAGGRTLDERLSSLPVLRQFACKVIVTAQRTTTTADVDPAP